VSRFETPASRRPSRSAAVRRGAWVFAASPAGWRPCRGTAPS